ncbi:MAG: glycosyltransferase [Desulfovibrio sp.]|nr:glycosyltransferase [Desulfovibrio sp.]
MNQHTILFIHQAFPAQFGSLAQYLVAEGHKVYAITMTPQESIRGVTTIKYAPTRMPLSASFPKILRETDTKLIRAESAYQAMNALKQQGLEPDIVYAHPGWGEALFVRDVWPKARFVVYAEWFYNVKGQEVNFDPTLPPIGEEQTLRLRMKNTPFLHALNDCDCAIAPTEWQKSRFPSWARKKITVMHEGLNLQELSSVRPRKLSMPKQDVTLRHGMPIVTFAARHLEPTRGFISFMRSLPAILAANKEAHVLVMGKDAGFEGKGYGSMNPNGTSWRTSIKEELGSTVDWKRVHFLGMLDRKFYLSMLKMSACHVYLTTPFILSWSFLEAAALGLPIVASDTAPVREFAHLNGLDFVGFTDFDGIAKKVLTHLRQHHDSFYSSNADAFASLDMQKTIPAICEVLMEKKSAKKKS